MRPALELLGGGGLAELAAHGEGVALYDPDTETWEPRPSGFKRVVFVSPVKEPPEPPDVDEDAHDEIVEPGE